MARGRMTGKGEYSERKQKGEGGMIGSSFMYLVYFTKFIIFAVVI